MVVHICIPSYSGDWGRRIAWAKEFKVTVSCDFTTALQLRWQSNTLSQKKERKFYAEHGNVFHAELFNKLKARSFDSDSLNII